MDQGVAYKDPGIARNSIIGQKDPIMVEMDLLLLHKKYKMTGSDAPCFVTKIQIWVDFGMRFIEILSHFHKAKFNRGSQNELPYKMLIHQRIMGPI